ncbi:MAG: hypothetical protein U0R64_01230 [Candidatus Nanopelagicales bacterium]
MGDAMALLVTGMHRSGTSMLAQWVTELGVPEVPGTAFPVDSANSEGLFERVEVVALDDRWLDRLGGSWEVPPLTSAQTWRTLDLHELEASRAQLPFLSGRTTQWFVKDPRICLLLPLWDRLALRRLPVVVGVRPHREVAQSLAVRNGMTLRRALALWAEYHRALVDSGGDRAGLVVDYDRALEAPHPAVAALGEFVAGGVPSDVVADVAATVKPQLRRQDTGPLAGSAERLAADLDEFRSVLGEAHLAALPTDLPPLPDWALEALDEMRELWMVRRELAAVREGRTAAERAIRRTGARLRRLGR